MKELSLKHLLRQFYRNLLNHFISEIEPSDLGRSAIVFAPHQDDETLGCGGTLIKKKRAGADIKIVFMTDGSRSQKRLISENELKSIRVKEAIAAAGVLGIEPQDVIFLEFKDGELEKNQAAAIARAREIILKAQPEEIFIPYYKEPLLVPDHVATNTIAITALKTVQIKATIYEYPIWFWRHWPWTSLVGGKREILTILKNSLIADLGFSLLRHFQCSVYIGDVLELKRAALEQHKSQMQRLIPDPAWGTLGDVSNGEFLECFFQEREIFRRYTLLGKG